MIEPIPARRRAGPTAAFIIDFPMRNTAQIQPLQAPAVNAP
jgi:hypothetical protein